MLSENDKVLSDSHFISFSLIILKDHVVLLNIKGIIELGKEMAMMNKSKLTYLKSLIMLKS